jgi:hypothetical protein
MLSIWRCREHSGIACEVNFSRMLRERWADLPKSVIGKARYIGDTSQGGTVDDRVCFQKPFAGTVLDRWLEFTQRFADSARLNIAYGTVCDRPLYVVRKVAEVFSLKRKAEFSPVLRTVGWQPLLLGESPIVTLADMELIEDYQRKLSL